ncbi:MAG: cyclase family protein [Pseudobdellovibrionaceae bacterium]
MKVYDLTPKIHPGLAVFPGDVAFKRDVSMDFEKGQHLLLSSIQTTLHIGAHADSSSHYNAGGVGIEQRPLTSYFGPAQVIHVSTRSGSRIGVEDLRDKKIEAPRVLFRTNSFPNPEHWNADFMALSPELIQYLKSQGCVLVGIDTPSVDPQDSKALESHQALFQTGIAVLEGLILTKVPEGLYTLVALPLPIEGGDASPVRALLFEDAALFPAFQTFEIQKPI